LSAQQKRLTPSASLFCFGVADTFFCVSVLADLYCAATGHDDLDCVATAGPSVSADLATQKTAPPADGRCFGAATGDANTYALVAATTRRIHAQCRLNRCRWTATWIASSGVVSTGSQRTQSDRSDRYDGTNS